MIREALLWIEAILTLAMLAAACWMIAVGAITFLTVGWNLLWK